MQIGLNRIVFCFFLWDCCVGHNAFSTVIEVGIFFLITMFHQVGFQVIYKVCNGAAVGVGLYEHARLVCKLYIFSVPQLQRTI